MHVAEMLAYVRSIAVVLVLIGVCGPGSAYFKVRSTVEFDMRWFTPVKYALDVGLQLVMGAAVFHEWDGVGEKILHFSTKIIRFSTKILQFSAARKSLKFQKSHFRLTRGALYVSWHLLFFA